MTSEPESPIGGVSRQSTTTPRPEIDHGPMIVECPAARLPRVLGLLVLVGLQYVILVQMGIVPALFERTREFSLNSPGSWVFFGLLLAGSVFLLGTTRVRLTAFRDGLVYRGVFRSLYLPWSEIVDVSRTGTRVTIRTYHRVLHVDWDLRRADRLLSVARQCIAGSRGERGSDDEKCPQCGRTELIRARRATATDPLPRPWARCLACGGRFKVDTAVFERLREPVLGEPFETMSDRHHLTLATPMTGTQIAITVAATVLGVSLGAYLSFRLDQPALASISLPIIFAGWWLGRAIAPWHEHRPGFCDGCGYDLRGLEDNRCPECGRRFETRRDG